MKNFAITLFTLALTSLFITNVNAQYWSNTTSSPSYSYIKANMTDYRGVILGGSAPEPITNAMFSVYGDSNQEGIVAYSDLVGITALSTGVALRAEGFNGGIAGEFLGDVQVQGELATTEIFTNKLHAGLNNPSINAALSTKAANGVLAAHFDGDVQVENGHVIIGDDIGLTGGLDALLQVKTSDAQTFGIRAESEHTIAVTGFSTNATGVSGASINGRGVYGSSVETAGVEGYSVNGVGLKGESENDIAIYGEALNGAAVKGVSGYDYGGYFETVDGAAALYASDRDGGSLAAHFDGNVLLNGTISGNVGAAGGIKIQTTQGYTEIGALNPWNTHFRTDRAQFYFSKKVRVAGDMRADGLVYSQGSVITSDKRLKKDVSKFQYGLDEVLQLNPLTYDYTGKGGTTSGDYNVGLFAQDLKKIAPEFVTEFTHRDMDEAGEVKNKKDYLQVYDTGIKYMLINATKEQQEIIDHQAKKIETLEETLAELQATVAVLMNNQTSEINQQSIRLSEETISLEQNQPNPFSTNTLIKYKLPKDATNAVVTIFNTNGQVMHEESIAQPGTGEIQLQANKLTAGTYSYTLTVDGRIIATKKMVVIK